MLPNLAIDEIFSTYCNLRRIIKKRNHVKNETPNMRWPFIKLNSRDRGLLWFEAETGEHRVVPAKVAAQLLLTEISNKILTDGKREKEGKT